MDALFLASKHSPPFTNITLGGLRIFLNISPIVFVWLEGE